MKSVICLQRLSFILPYFDKVNHSKVTFRNRYGITLAADMYTPKNAEGKLAAIPYNKMEHFFRENLK